MIGDIENAIRELHEKLPGWWFTVGECSVSCDATVGPDRYYNSRSLCDFFDSGFDCDLAQPSSLADALRGATDEALRALSEYTGK